MKMNGMDKPLIEGQTGGSLRSSKAEEKAEARKKILLVEDEAITAMDLKSNLIQLGYEVPGGRAAGGRCDTSQQLICVRTWS